MLTRALPPEGPAGQGGFTLIETLVAMVAGMIVIGALFGILEIGLHQSTRLNDVNVATQSGRMAMTRMVDELHSACLSSKFAPVQAGSTSTKLIVVDGYGEASTLPLPGTSSTKGFEGVRKDTLEWKEEPEPNTPNHEGLLRDKIVTATGEPNASGEYPYGAESPVGGLIFGERISAYKAKLEGSTATPMFTYYSYGTSASSGKEVASSDLSKIELAGELSPAQAKTVAAVRIAFHALPSDKKATINRSIEETGVDLNSLVTFAFSAPNSEATIKAVPCE